MAWIAWQRGLNSAVFRALTSLCVTGVMTGWAVTCPAEGGQPRAATQDDHAARGESRPDSGSSSSQEELQARWKRLQADYVRIATPLVESIERLDQARRLEEDVSESLTDATTATLEARVGREVAELQLNSYTEQVAQLELETAKQEIAVGESRMRMIEERLESSRLARRQIGEALAGKRNILAAAEILARLQADRAVEDDELALASGKDQLEKAKQDQAGIVKYQQRRKTLELRSALEKHRSAELKSEGHLIVARGRAELAKRQRSERELLPEEERLISLLAAAAPRDRSSLPWDRPPAEFSKYLDELEAKLREARPLAEQIQARRESLRILELGTRLRRDGR